MKSSESIRTGRTTPCRRCSALALRRRRGSSSRRRAPRSASTSSGAWRTLRAATASPCSPSRASGGPPCWWPRMRETLRRARPSGGRSPQPAREPAPRPTSRRRSSTPRSPLTSPRSRRVDFGGWRRSSTSSAPCRDQAPCPHLRCRQAGRSSPSRLGTSSTAPIPTRSVQSAGKSWSRARVDLCRHHGLPRPRRNARDGRCPRRTLRIGRAASTLVHRARGRAGSEGKQRGRALPPQRFSRRHERGARVLRRRAIGARPRNRTRAACRRPPRVQQRAHLDRDACGRCTQSCCKTAVRRARLPQDHLPRRAREAAARICRRLSARIAPPHRATTTLRRATITLRRATATLRRARGSARACQAVFATSRTKFFSQARGAAATVPPFIHKNRSRRCNARRPVANRVIQSSSASIGRNRSSCGLNSSEVAVQFASLAGTRASAESLRGAEKDRRDPPSLVVPRAAGAKQSLPSGCRAAQPSPGARAAHATVSVASCASAGHSSVVDSPLFLITRAWQVLRPGPGCPSAFCRRRSAFPECDRPAPREPGPDGIRQTRFHPAFSPHRCQTPAP